MLAPHSPRALALRAAVTQRGRALRVCRRRVRALATAPQPSRAPTVPTAPAVALPPPLTLREREAFDLRLVASASAVAGAGLDAGEGVRVGDLVVVEHARRVVLVRVLEVHALNRVFVTSAPVSTTRVHAAPSRLLFTEAALVLALGDPWALSGTELDELALSSELRALEERARSLSRGISPSQRAAFDALFASAPPTQQEPGWFTVEQAARVLFPALMLVTADARERIVARYATLQHLLWRWDNYTALPHAVFAPRPRGLAQVWRAMRRALNDDARVSRFLTRVRGALLQGAQSALWGPVLRAASLTEEGEGAFPLPLTEPDASEAEAAATEWRASEDADAREFVFALTHAALGREGGPVFMGEVHARLLRPLGVRAQGGATVHALLRDLGVLDVSAAVPELAEQLAPEPWGPVLTAPAPPSPAAAPAAADAETHVELHSELAYAVDSADTTEVDDAVSFTQDARGDTWLHVHVADPCAVLQPSSSLALEAQRRATTVYLPHTRYAMLPATLHAPLGLDDAVPHSRALTFSARLDADGAVADARVTLTRVPVRRVTFNHVEALLDRPLDQRAAADADADAALQRVLQQWQRLAHVRRAYRYARGAVTAQLPQSLSVQVERDASSGGVRVGLVHKSTPRASMLVEEAMIVAAEVAARIAQENALPIAFRTQTAPSHVPVPLSPEELAPATSPEHATLVETLRLFAHMPSATLQATPARHHSLALDVYARATSPLRRFADLITHWQLRALLTRGRTRAPFTVSELDAMLPLVHYTSKRAQQLQRFAERHWKLRWVAHTILARGRQGQAPPVYRAVVYAVTAPITLREALERDASASALGVDLVSGAEVALRVRHLRYFVLDLELSGALIAPLDRVRDVRVGALLGLRARVRDDARQHVIFDLAPMPETEADAQTELPSGAVTIEE